MAAIANNMLEAGAGIYSDPRIKNNVNKKFEKKKGPK